MTTAGTTTRASVHPATRIDAEAAASTMAASMSGDGPFWDPVALARRPGLADEATLYAGDVVAFVRDHMPDAVPHTASEPGPRHPDHRDAIRAWCATRAEEAIAQLTGLAIDARGTIAVERVLACDPADLRSALGVFWSTDVQHGGILAAPWGTPGSPEILVTARIHHDDVDWATSCVARMEWYSGDDERELRLHPGRPLLDVRAWSWDQTLILRNRRGLVLPDLDWTT